MLPVLTFYTANLYVPLTSGVETEKWSYEVIRRLHLDFQVFFSFTNETDMLNVIC